MGQIGYHDRSKVKTIRVEKNNVIVNRLNKTKEERFPNLAAEQEARAAEFRSEEKAAKRAAAQAEKSARLAREEAAKIRSYASIMVPEKMTSNAEFAASVDESAAKDFEEDFM